MRAKAESNMDYIQIDDVFKIRKTKGQFTLLKKVKVSTGKNKGTLKWSTCGYYGSVLSALKGYTRHSIDTCSSVQEILETVYALDKKLGENK